MSMLAGSTEDTWHPVTAGDTTAASYWLNWRFLLCAVWVLASMNIALVLIWKKEQNLHCQEVEEERKEEAFLYDDQAWMPSLKGIHPAWLLVFRLSAFSVLLLLLVVSVLVGGSTVFYYYTQWTFTLVTFYFAIGSLLSIRGCYSYHKRASGDRVGNAELDAEHGESSMSMKGSNPAVLDRQPAGKWVYAFQIIFQMNAGAVMLTDCVFWLIIVPFLAIKDYHLNALIVSMHSMNAIFLLGDTAMNCMPFPFFRIAYFIIWTIVYVVFQWILHASVKLWWPYPFLDMSSPYVPLWYFAVAVMHVPCYGVFAFIVKVKNTLLTRWFPDSYRGRS
ncbi:hypothetical protein LINPERHAP2_LOCUS34342 [Linum perenne]